MIFLTAALLTGLYVAISVAVAREQADSKGRRLWEYRVVHATSFVEVKDLLGDQRKACVELEKEFNRLGADGWELSHEVDGIFIFKRAN